MIEQSPATAVGASIQSPGSFSSSTPGPEASPVDSWMMDSVTGRSGELIERLLDVVDRPQPQLRAVATTLLIKAVDIPDEEMTLMESMVASDEAAVMIDPIAAATARNHLRRRLGSRLWEMADDHGESAVVRVMRDHLTAQIERWGVRAVDDADNRRRAERFLAWAERPGQLEAAQRRGLFAGMDAGEFRRLADTRMKGPVTPETALQVWTQLDEWVMAVDTGLGDAVLAAWDSAAPGA